MENQESLSFSQAIQATQSLIKKINAQQLNEADVESEVSFIVNSKNGGRGFLVVYLTDNLSLSDQSSKGIINALRSSEKIVSELLVKNLAMSSAMIVTHSRNNDLSNIEGSKRIRQRTTNLIQKIKLDSINKELEKLRTTISNEGGEYNDFLERWEYDTDQQQAIYEAITAALI